MGAYALPADAAGRSVGRCCCTARASSWTGRPRDRATRAPRSPRNVRRPRRPAPRVRPPVARATPCAPAAAQPVFPSRWLMADDHAADRRQTLSRYLARAGLFPGDPVRIGHHKASEVAVIGQLAALRSGTPRASARSRSRPSSRKGAAAPARRPFEAEARLVEHYFFMLQRSAESAATRRWERFEWSTAWRETAALTERSALETGADDGA
jgi:hypothetical protein